MCPKSLEILVLAASQILFIVMTSCEGVAKMLGNTARIICKLFVECFKIWNQNFKIP